MLGRLSREVGSVFLYAHVRFYFCRIKLIERFTTMAKNNKYQLHLKGYVGSWDFDSDYVDYVLSNNEGKEVSVLIDSPGGQLNTALSISSAFKRHGNVHAHFVGMNASAATIASMGAKRITMDHSAMYLVHQCALPFCKIGSLNADDMSALMSGLLQAKTDLEKMDANVAAMYATRCKKEPKALLALMKQGGWLTAQEALDWGFVDELTEYEDEAAPVLTASMAADFTAYGIPLPNIPNCPNAPKADEANFFQRMAQAFASVFKPQDNVQKQINHQPNTTPMNKVYKQICKFLAVENFAVNDDKISLTTEQMDNLECSMQANKDMIAELSLKVKQTEDENKQLIEANKSLQAQLEAKPAEGTTNVVETQKQSEAEPTAFELFVNTTNSAQELFDKLP